MPSIQQPIRNYNVQFVHTRGAVLPAVHTRTRFIHLQFGTDSNNLSLLILGFIADAPSATTGDIVKLTNGTVRVSARVPATEFAAYYDMIRNEQPLSVRIDFAAEPGIGQTVQLDSFSLFSGPEPLGEGSRDTSL